MRWGQVIIAFILGTFFGPWVLSLFGGKKQAASY
jgi:hypothetical protein